MPYGSDYAARQTDIQRRLAEARRAQQATQEGAFDRNNVEALKKQWGVQGATYYEGDDEDQAKRAYELTAKSDTDFRGIIERRLQDLQRERQETAFEAAQSYTPERLEMEGVGSGYRARDISSMPQYNNLRNAMTNRLRGQADAARTTASNAMQRQFARLGGLNSGSAIKAQANLNQQSQEQESEALSRALADVGMQEASAQQNEWGREFQSQEAIRQRNAGRQQFNSDADFKAAVFRADAASRLGQMDMAFNQFDWQKYLDQNNIAMNQQQIENSKSGFFEKAVGAIGAIGGLATGAGAIGFSPFGKKG